MKLQSLQDLYHHELQDLRDAEDRIMEILPRMAEAATDQGLKDHLQRHGEQARTHRDRLDELLEKSGKATDNVICAGMRGILHEAERLMDEPDLDDAVRDAALLSIAQKSEHYEMASYGALRTYAQLLGESGSAEKLQKTLDEEGQADDRLTEIAKKSVNPAAQA